MLGAGPDAGGVACVCEGVYFWIFFQDGEAVGFLLDIAMSCLRALSRQRHGAGTGCWQCAW